MQRASTTHRLIDRYLGIPVLRAAAILNRRRPMPSEINTIGNLSSPPLGDTLLTSAAVADIRQAYPGAHLTFFTSPGAHAAVTLIPGIDRILPINITKPVLTLRTLRAAKLDLLVDFTQWLRITALYTGLSGAKHRIGFNSLKQHRHWLYDHAVQHSSHRHELENYRTLLSGLGIRSVSPPSLAIPADHREPRKHAIVFHPWANGQNAALREWDTENWVSLAVRLASCDSTFFVTGTMSELPRSQHLCSELKRAGLSADPFMGTEGLLGISQLLKHAELVVSVNTGIMHLAAILGAPTISLNGPTASHRWGPVGHSTRSVEPRGGGGGFLHFGFEFAGTPTDTMQRIHVDDVFTEAQSLIPRLHQSAVSA